MMLLPRDGDNREEGEDNNNHDGQSNNIVYLGLFYSVSSSHI